MQDWRLLTFISCLALASGVTSQFFDFFQPFQPYLQPRTTTQRPIQRQQSPEYHFGYNDNIRSPVTSIDRERDRNTNRRNQGTRNTYSTTELPISNYFASLFDHRDDARQASKANKSKKPTNNQRYNGRGQSEATKPPAKIHTNEDTWNLNPYSETSRKDKRRPSYENGFINEINANTNQYTQRPSQVTTKAPVFNFNYNPWTTQNPFYQRPGIVRPAVFENRPPITNRPSQYTTQRTVYNQRPDFGGEDDRYADDGPDLVTGPNEDYMSDVEKRRYIELAERMCDRYKALQVKQLSAIPLLPSPDPVSVNVSKCVPVNVPLVVGGRVASIQEFPHMALLGWNKLQGGGYSWKCGGSLVSEQFVLTAAHCSYQERDDQVVTGPPRVVQLGSSFLDDPGAIVVRVSSAIRHPRYKLPRSYYDLAVLKLRSKVSFSERIRPACLGVPPPPDNHVIATGWGRTEFGGEQSHELRSVSIPIWEISRCREALGTSRKMPTGPAPESQVCAGERNGGKDTCQGDSGGPIQVREGCAWRVVGVTSLGRACGAAHTPGLYAVAQRAFVSAVAYGGR